MPMVIPEVKALRASNGRFARRRADVGLCRVDFDRRNNDRVLNTHSILMAEATEVFEKIVELLVSAGYFRARIPALSPFDKVVGGMAWCITASNVDVDFDVSFQENPKIGEKIKIAENIIEGLRLSKCPLKIQPSQIQGLDYPKLYPVIQWLVKRAFEFRSAEARNIRQNAEAQFGKCFAAPAGAPAGPEELGRPFVERVLKNYFPRRAYKHKPFARLPEETVHIQTTLLEYGRQTRLTLDGAEAGAESTQRAGPSAAMQDRISAAEGEQATAARKKDAEEQAQAALAQEEQTIALLMAGMVQGEGAAEGKVSTSSVGALVTLETEAIRRAAEAYGEQMRQSEAATRQSAVAAQRQQQELLAKQLAGLQGRLEQSKQKVEAGQGRLTAAQQARAEHRARMEQLTETLERLKAAEEGADQRIVGRLHQLVRLNESFREQERRFKQHCRQQLAAWQGRIGELEAQLAAGAEDQNAAALRATLEQETQRVAQMRAALALRTREAAALSRQIDEVPTRAELIQYQTRFVELFDRMATTLEETRKHFNCPHPGHRPLLQPRPDPPSLRPHHHPPVYNALLDRKGYLTNELGQLQSLQRTFETALKSRNLQKPLLESFQTATAQVQQLAGRMEQRQADEKRRHDALEERYTGLVETQRSYFKLVKLFQEECDLNERLSNPATAAEALASLRRPRRPPQQAAAPQAPSPAPAPAPASGEADPLGGGGAPAPSPRPSPRPASRQVASPAPAPAQPPAPRPAPQPQPQPQEAEYDPLS
ncbi:putative Coiled-coil domain-containing protein (DUF2037) [Paratrimastix pyriformis]|uniref:Coiled-coil domain-containing protein (DUF2037) n=1 Tax=Paratrimastix pyriformis TaxID=342808 RepID=A0ABQ8UQC3_9EUKA|nr:putative Coiled-coil domain-containing protein (DUF2037) [Paratrimastix pyriformis]